MMLEKSVLNVLLLYLIQNNYLMLIMLALAGVTGAGQMTETHIYLVKQNNVIKILDY